MRSTVASLTAVLVLCAVPPCGAATRGFALPAFAVGYSTEAGLHAALAAHPGVVVRRLGPLHVAEVRPAAPGFARAVRALPGIRFVARIRSRRSAVDPALFLAP